MAEAPETATEVALAQAEIIAGMPAQAARRLRALVAHDAGDPISQYWLATALGADGDWDGHRVAMKTAQEVHAFRVIAGSGGDLNRLGADPAYAAQIGDVLYGQRMVGLASAAYGLAAEGAPDNLNLLLRYGLSLQHQGRVEEAVSAFRRACELAPTDGQARGFLLYALFHVPDGVKVHAQAAREFARLFDDAPRKPAESFTNRPLQGRKLRIGYVAPDVMGTQLRQFMVPVLEHHNREAVEVFHYMQAEPAIAPPIGQVRAIGALSDGQAARLIRDDRIDVLIDLWGHTANGRLGVFARRAAPVQASWMNYMQTTGLREMDYLIHPDAMNVPGAQDDCTETLWHIGPDLGPFRPDPRPDPTPTPALAAGFVTFGSYTHPVRLSDQTLDGWSRILKAVDGSRLVLRYGYYADEVLKNTILTRFAARGVAQARIHFRGHVVQPEYYQSYAEIDLALDPAPCPTGTTSLDAVANGVPVLTLAGADYYSRNGAAIVGPLGLDELITENWDDYVERAVALTADHQALDGLRSRVRAAFDSSSRRDEVGFTCLFEATLADMFQRWRDGRRSEAAA
jgi:predicted O-linked N-acetylglucosamine transferase (SPINDLY family)